MRLAGHVAHMGEIGTACKVLLGKPEGNKSFVKPKRRWEIGKIDGIEGTECGVWAELMWLRVGTGGGML